jgi:hypothetical protein
VFGRFVKASFDSQFDDVRPGQNKIPPGCAAFDDGTARSLAKEEVVVLVGFILPLGNELEFLIQELV